MFTQIHHLHAHSSSSMPILLSLSQWLARNSVYHYNPRHIISTLQDTFHSFIHPSIHLLIISFTRYLMKVLRDIIPHLIHLFAPFLYIIELLVVVIYCALCHCSLYFQNCSFTAFAPPTSQSQNEKQNKELLLFLLLISNDQRCVNGWVLVVPLFGHLVASCRSFSQSNFGHWAASNRHNASHVLLRLATLLISRFLLFRCQVIIGTRVKPFFNTSPRPSPSTVNYN